MLTAYVMHVYVLIKLLKKASVHLVVVANSLTCFIEGGIVGTSQSCLTMHSILHNYVAVY